MLQHRLSRDPLPELVLWQNKATAMLVEMRWYTRWPDDVHTRLLLFVLRAQCRRDAHWRNR